MVVVTIFSMEDHILTVLRKDKGTVLKNNRGNLGKAAGACVRAWANSGNISTRCSLMKRTDSDDHVFEVTFEHIVDSQTHRPHHNWSKMPHLCTLCKWCSLITWLHHWIQGGLLLKAIFMPEPKKLKIVLSAGKDTKFSTVKMLHELTLNIFKTVIFKRPFWNM